jgi:hypothetical protein
MGKITIYENKTKQNKIKTNTNIIHIISKFLKFTNIIINKNVIQSIDINKDKFLIHLTTNKTNGVLIFAIGGFSYSYNTKVEVCKTKNLSDYETVTDWIDNEFK